MVRPGGRPARDRGGSLILEVQEPTDFSIVLERRGFPVADNDAHLGLGWDVALDAIDTRGTSDDELDALRSDATAVGSLLVPDAAPFFSVQRVRAAERRRLDLPPRFVVGVVVAGSGVLRTQGGELPVRSGTTFAIPATASRDVELDPTIESLELLLCSGAG